MNEQLEMAIWHTYTHRKSYPTSLKLLTLFPSLFQVLFTVILLLSICMAVEKVEYIINSRALKDSQGKDSFQPECRV